MGSFRSERLHQRLTSEASPSKEYKDDAEKRAHRHRHFWSAIGLCTSSFSMFYLIMNVFPYSGFMALHLINGKLRNDDDVTSEQQSLYVTAATIGPYAAILASSFRLGRIPTAIPWGSCADVYGRKFTLVIGMLAMIAGNILFGLAPTFASAVGIRFCTGLWNGTMVVVRTSISEIAKGDPKLESKGVAMMSSMSGYGMLIGPAIGGLLSDPIRQYPSYFHINDSENNCDDNGNGESRSCGGPVRLFWKNLLGDYPFLLPNLIGSIVAILSLLIVVICVEETLPKNQRRDWRLIPIDIGSWIAARGIFQKQQLSAFAKRSQHHKILINSFPKVDKPEMPSSLHDPAGINATDATDDERTLLLPLTKNTSSQTVCSASTVQDDSNSSIQTLQGQNNRKSVVASFLDTKSKVRYFFYSMWLFAFSSLASLETFPLFAMASTTQGGLGLDETGIGLVQTIAGCIFVAGQYTAFSVAIKKLGLMKALQISNLCRSLLVLLFPLGLYFSSPKGKDCDAQINTAAINSSSPKCIHGNNWYQLGYLGLVTGVMSILGSIFMGCSTIGVNACINDASQRASMNGLQSMVASVGRGLGPLFAGYLAAATMKSETISAEASAWVIYGVLMVMEVITYLSTRFIPVTGLPTA